MEMGWPMAAMYLLGNPDHYTSHDFVCCYWKNYTRWVTAQWEPNTKVADNGDDELDPDRVLMRKCGNCYIAYSVVDDYRCRPVEYADVPLHTWV
ncbi:hypothetical protein FIBSPDRAFT_665770, partial [Athelia psychrophila]